MQSTEFIEALRSLLAFFEANPEFPAPDSLGFYGGKIECTYFGHCGAFRADTPEGLATFSKLVGGRVEKKMDDDSFEMIAERPGYRLRTYTSRNNICQQVVVGVKYEPEHVLPAQPEQVIPAKEVPIYEWRCGSILAESHGADAPETGAA